MEKTNPHLSPALKEIGSLAPWNRRAMLRWLAALGLALLLHVFFMTQSILFPAKPQRMPVDLSPVSPQQLEKLRQQWKQKERSFLLSKDKNPPVEAPAPKDANYESDRNRTVEKEMRARQTQVIPQSGQTQATTSSSEAQPKREPLRPPIGLSQLGVPLNLQKKAPPPRPAPAAERPGGDQALRDQTLPEGSENLLNTVESRYYSFYSRLYEAIGPVWQSRINEIPLQRQIPVGDYVTAVEVVLDQHGNLVGINHLRNSGVPEFDEAVDTAWRRIGRFPNPPRALLGEDGLVRTGWSFAVQMGRSTGLQLAPPERAY